MRTLNRPMFNWGGPVKQGIMHGIREPYRGGGAALVGNPVYPQTGGREHHQGVIGTAGKVFGGIGKLFGGSGGWWSKIRPTSRFRQPPVPKGYPTKDVGKWYGSRFKTGQGFEGPAPYTKMEMLKKPKLLWEGIKENPYWTGAAGVYGAAPAYAVAKGTVPGIAKTIADVAVPDFIYNWETGKWFNPDDKDIKKIDKKAIVQGNVSATGPETTDTSTEESRAAFAKKQRTQRVNKYLDLMGYDRSKKTAIADALIDASQIVGGKRFKDIDITTEVINPIIQSASRRLDKPEQIREAVGLMMTKADLEKEMYDAKPGTQMKAAQDYVGQFGGTYANAYKQLGLTKKGSWTESLSALSKAYGGKSPKNQDILIQNIMLQKEGDPDFDVSQIKVIGDQAMLDQIKKEENFISVSDVIMRTQQDDAGNVKPGIYLIGNAVVEVTETGIKQLN